MKNGYYLSTYFFINKLAHITNTELRHDMNMSLWHLEDNKVELVKYWELERVTGIKQHNRAFFDENHAKKVIEQLLGEMNLSLDDINEIWGTPEIDTVHDYHSLNQYKDYCYHSICHLFSSLLMDTKKFNSEEIISLAVDGAPDNVIDLDIENKYYYTGAYSKNGEIKGFFPIASPGIHWGFIRDYFHMREGSLMALATASKSELIDYPLKTILVTGKDQVSDAIDDVIRLIEYVDQLSKKDEGKLFTGYDTNFSEKDNKISMVVKEVQKISELILYSNIDDIVKKFGLDTKKVCIAMSGGFCLNCPSNSAIMSKYGFKEFIGVPCVNDAGMSLGIALYAFYKKLSNKMSFCFQNAYYGENDTMLVAIRDKYHEFISDVQPLDYETIVKDIEDGPIIWFRGNSEIGPRALGNRSLIADPRSEKSKDILNVVKQRQWWRPVAPVVMAEHVTEWFEDAYESPYMLNTFLIKDEKRKEVPAILHMDNSARVQTLSSSHNKELYNVLNIFYQKTEVPILCNTSLNDKGEPIINTLEELVYFALNKSIKIAYVNNYRVEFQDIDHKWKNNGVCKRKVEFNEYLSKEEQEKILKEINPFDISGEQLLVFIQNPKLYPKVDLTKKSSLRILDGIMKIRKNRFHVV